MAESDGAGRNESSPDESAPEATRLWKVEAFLEGREFENHLQLAEMGGVLLLEYTSRFMTPYESQAFVAESTNRFFHRAPVSRRQISRVAEIRKDQVRKARERKAGIFAEHEWVEVPNAHPASDQGLATQPVETGFSVASSNEAFPGERR
jgi:hypothetical protein